MEAVLGIQAIGQEISFYIMLLPASGVYVFLELGKVQVPSNMQDLTKLVMSAPLLLLVIDVFEGFAFPKSMCITLTDIARLLTRQGLTKCFR